MFKKVCTGLWICIWCYGCYPEEQRLDPRPAAQLYFSKDTVQFDTLLSGMRSPSYGVRLHNPNERAVEVQHIWLEGGKTSPFAMWVRGQLSTSLGPLRILGQDSVLLLLEAHSTGRTRTEPAKETDNLWIRSAAGLTHLPLEIWVQDAIYIKQLSITQDTRWAAEAARRIGKELHIAQQATLSLGPGMQLFFAPEARMYIEGRLQALGTFEKPILFSSQRQDGAYKNTPGQWEGLIFAPNNQESRLEHVTISNAVLGLRLGKKESHMGAPLRLGYATIKHMSNGGLLSYGGNTFVYNTLFYNAKAYLVTHYGGGRHRYLHCTLSNYPSSFFQREASLQITDYLPTDLQKGYTLRFTVQNSILWGHLSEELQLDLRGKPEQNLWHIQIEHNLVRSLEGAHLTQGNNFWQDTYNYPAFVDAERYNYRLSSDSPARDSGKSLSDNEQQRDLQNKARSLRPDIGAYEWIAPE